MNRIASPRDVIILRENDMVLVSAVDSCGSVGMLPHDALSCPLEIAGRFTARVALMEILAVGAQPLFASVPISNSPEVAEKILNGIRDVLGSPVPLVVSTEKNMPTTMTAFGITVTGGCKASALRIGCAERGDILYCAGMPLVGGETLVPDAKLPEPFHIASLLRNPLIHGIIPAGSRGIAAEARVLAEESRLTPVMDKNSEINLHKSAGPSSCFVFAGQAGAEPFDISLPVTRIGYLA